MLIEQLSMPEIPLGAGNRVIKQKRCIFLYLQSWHFSGEERQCKGDK